MKKIKEMLKKIMLDNYMRMYRKVNCLQRIIHSRFFKQHIAPIKFREKKVMSYVQDFFGFSTYTEALDALAESYSKFLKDWNEKKPSTRNELLGYYTSTDVYIAGLVDWHFRLDQKILNYLRVKQCSGKVLDYGGGIGNLSLMAYKKGCDVTYAEVAGKTIAFARFLFEKENAKIRVLEVPKDTEKLETYDTILFIDVIEHLSDEDQKNVLDLLIKSLKKGGKLIITNYMCEGNNDQMPQDRKVCYDVKKYLIDQGFEALEWWMFRKNDKI